ncbi:MAG: isoprenylcysteine carboxylmethyltransferase family protein [Deltaproteobacteria bacterium]|uniref:methyltransferase family protein n=1 Tax=Desulfobacula sp. TaxID=2593537 RepID=UPI0019A790C7|nr:isoprenylcysteine carboxylmethyltransferase family protein [Candidatus Desulfobacula maris]MBL6995555.1 isoprenylcysteine carboxylmethyltransferase family protein [Desulfobacula sp.]
MENDSKDSAGIRIPPPLYFFACLGFGLLLEYFFPIHLVSLSLTSRAIVGCIFTLISLYFAVSGFIALIKSKTPFDTAKSTVKIVKTGAYRFSRNPLYLSLLLLLFGIAFSMLSLWLFFTVPILFILFLFNAVKPEESYLSQKFGNEYLDYSANVRRWF